MMNKVVEDYVLMQSVGKGQYGNVYRAQHRKTGQLFAVKVMSAQKFKHTPKLSQFTNNQINILTKINHPNIIRFVQMLRTANNYYLVYQFCNGGTLGDYIKSKKRLPQDQSLKIFSQLRSAFELLNKQKILHRDLKPTNILFHNGVIKIADFGFCKEMLKQQMTQTMVGSPIYMAPEVLKGSIYDNRADIWSLGVILYEMLFGFCPYEENSITKLINLIDNTLLKFPQQVTVSNHIKILLKRMMTIKYRQRITPNQFIKYPLEVKQCDSPLLPKTQKNSGNNLGEAMIFSREMMTYLGQTLQILAEKLQNQLYVLISFMVYKILASIQKDIFSKSVYWEHIKITNKNEQWDLALMNQVRTLQPFGTMIKEGVLCNNPSIKTKLQLQTNYIDFKYFLDIISQVRDEQIKTRLLNCIIINRHYMLVLQKKRADFTNYMEVRKNLDQKQNLCKKFAYTRT